MCVIMVTSKDGPRPSENMIEKAWDANPHGAGIAWREGRGDKAEIHWEKGIMEIDRIKELCAKVPNPYTVHFRVASCGGIKPSLTHPFLVHSESPLILRGRTRGGVLFHNGHWGPWNDKALDAAIYSNTPLPKGADWSDSRALAWLISIYGPEVMELLPSQRGVLMTPDSFRLFTGPGWEKINDVWCSNDHFVTGWKRYNNNNKDYGKLCQRQRCSERAYGGNDVCDKCKEADRKRDAELNGSSETKKEEPTQQSIVTGGVSPLDRPFSMRDVENMHKANMISKSLLKNYRKAHWNCGHKDESKKRRALKKMAELSAVISERIMNVEAAGLTN